MGSPPETLGIEDYGLIGDMHTNALVGTNGSIDFMCWPKCDSDSLFCRVLDTTRGGGGHWSIKPRDFSVRKQNYLPATNILQTRWISEEGVIVLTDFFAIRTSTGVDCPVLVRKVECLRGNMCVDIDLSPAPNYARETKGEHYRTALSESTIMGASVFQTIHWETSRFDGRKTGPTHSHCPGVSVLFLDAEADADPESRPSISRKTSKDKRTLFEYVSRPRPNNSDGARASLNLREGQQLVMVMSAYDMKVETMEDLVSKYERDTSQYWVKFARKCLYTGRHQQYVERSLLCLKLLTYEPTGAIIASPTFSLPESIGGGRNWDYRYSWIRDSAFTIYIFLKMGYSDEAEAYINFIFARIHECWERTQAGANADLPLMFTVDGDLPTEDIELDHLGGHKDSRPVRIGNSAITHIQLDIYGELMDAIYLYNKHGKPISYHQWLTIRELIEHVSTIWNDPDMSIWEVRGKKENFVYSKIMLWVAFDRALRLAEKRNLPCPKRQEWMITRDTIYEQIMTHGYNRSLNSFIQSYESNTIFDAAVLIAPLVFFMTPNDPMFLGTLDQILKAPEKGGLTSAGLVFRYNVDKTDDGVGGKEGTFTIVTFWAIEALVRAAKYQTPTTITTTNTSTKPPSTTQKIKKKPDYLDLATSMFENATSFSNHLGLFSEEIALSGEQLGNTPQAFSHLAFVSAALNLERVSGRRGVDWDW